MKFQKEHEKDLWKRFWQSRLHNIPTEYFSEEEIQKRLVILDAFRTLSIMLEFFFVKIVFFYKRAPL